MVPAEKDRSRHTIIALSFGREIGNWDVTISSQTPSSLLTDFPMDTRGAIDVYTLKWLLKISILEF